MYPKYIQMYPNFGLYPQEMENVADLPLVWRWQICHKYYLAIKMRWLDKLEMYGVTPIFDVADLPHWSWLLHILPIPMYLGAWGKVYEKISKSKNQVLLTLAGFKEEGAKFEGARPPRNG